MLAPDMDDLTTLTATALAAAIRDRKVSSVEAVEAHLQRIAEVNPRINAVVQLDDRALENARLADEALVRGDDLGPLHGVPFTAKDWIETEGVVCTGGFVESAGRIPKRDATVVARMRAAGAILLGKTNVRADNPVYGPTRNPYDLERTPGGSSSGEAAIIAAGGSPLGLGSDSGGSIRFPAHCCGIAALEADERARAEHRPLPADQRDERPANADRADGALGAGPRAGAAGHPGPGLHGRERCSDASSATSRPSMSEACASLAT